ncbi:TonB-dependent receptor [Pontibacter sp. BT731]|uniref:TonB-dependent receptor plug domain-containing protein n=1 Tax=Pontibacter coccineus TaxID=3063328 RepID=UPI0026E1EA91|nr:TonB-dependent receptor [Pontibacter sp. BT731]MDO6389364.1 TonB-dependent receptor [Pontibacter sp. BT731]
MAKFHFHFLSCLALSLGIAPTAVAQQQDTTLYHLRTVEVFGKPAEVFASGSRVTTLDSTFLRTYTSGSLADALQARTPVFLKTNGPSGISTPSFRGTSATHTAVLWNGLNISQPALGQSDMSLLPLSSIGSIAVQHGAAGATYGSGAIGGAVLLNSPTQLEPGFGAEALQEVGSFGRYFSSANARYSGRKMSVALGGYYLAAENDFSFRDYGRIGGPTRRQDQAQVAQHGFTQDVRWQLSQNTRLALHGWYTYANREVPPALGAANTNAGQVDRNLRLMTELNHGSNWGETSLKAAVFNDYLLFTDNSNHSTTDINTYQLQAEQTYTYARRWSLRGGLNLQHFEADVQGYGKQVTEDRASAFLLFRYDPSKRLDLSLNLRQAFVKGYNPAPAPTLGANWLLLEHDQHQLYLKGNVSGSYRVPTLNERFWQPGGNPDIKPEQGWSFETGLRHHYTLGTVQLESELSVYRMLVDNWIQWMPVTSSYWSPRNLQKVRAQGIELSSRATTTRGDWQLAATGAYTYTASEQVKAYEGSQELNQQLAHVPLHKAQLGTDISFRTWTLLGNLTHTGLRYTDNSNASSLPGYTLLSLALHKKFSLAQNQFVASVRSGNVTNRAYTVLENVPMPPRSLAVSLRFVIP